MIGKGVRVCLFPPQHRKQQGKERVGKKVNRGSVVSIHGHERIRVQCRCTNKPSSSKHWDRTEDEHHAQESGMAGENGIASEAMIMREFRTDRRGRMRVPGSEVDVEEEIQGSIGGERCMRVVIDRAMDRRVDWMGVRPEKSYVNVVNRKERYPMLVKW